MLMSFRVFFLGLSLNKGFFNSYPHLFGFIFMFKVNILNVELKAVIKRVFSLQV